MGELLMSLVMAMHCSEKPALLRGTFRGLRYKTSSAQKKHALLRASHEWLMSDSWVTHESHEWLMSPRESLWVLVSPCESLWVPVSPSWVPVRPCESLLSPLASLWVSPESPCVPMRSFTSIRGEERRGSASSILFLLIKPLHQEMNVTKGIFSVYVHTLKVSYQLRYSYIWPLFIDFRITTSRGSYCKSTFKFKAPPQLHHWFCLCWPLGLVIMTEVT